MKNLLYTSLFLFIGIALKSQSMELVNNHIKVCKDANIAIFQYNDMTNVLEYKIESTNPTPSFLDKDFTSIPDDSLIIIPIPQNQPQGTYSANVYICNANDTLLITNPIITLTILDTLTSGSIEQGNTSICEGTTFSYTIGELSPAIGGDSVYQYRWRENNVPIQGSGSTLPLSWNNKPSGTYTYTREVRDSACSGWKISDGAYTVKVISPIVANLTASDTVVCSGLSPTLFVVATGGDSLTYQWEEKVSSSWMPISGKTQAIYSAPSFPNDTTLYYRCNVSDKTCSPLTSNSVKIHYLAPFDAGSIDTKDSVNCSGTINLTINGSTAIDGSGNYSYQWKMNNTVITGQINTALNNHTISSSGNYILTREAKDNLCSQWVASSGTYTLTVTSIPDIPSQPVGSNALCQSETHSDYSVPAVDNAINYTWELSDATAGEVFGNGNHVSVIWNPEFSGQQVNLQVKANGICGSSSFSPALIITKHTPKISFTTGESFVCANQKNSMYSVDFLNDATYLWSVENGQFEQGTNSNEIYVHWNNSPDTSAMVKVEVTVKITDSSQCELVVQYPVSIGSGTAPELNAIIAKTYTNGTPYMLMYPNPAQKFAYQWYQDNKPIEGATEQYFHPANFGKTLNLESEYKVFVSDFHNVSCGSFSEIYKATKAKALIEEGYFLLYPNPTNGDFTICFDEKLIEKSKDAFLTITTYNGVKIVEERIDITTDFIHNKKMQPGIYLLSIRINDENYTQKLIIQ